MGPTQQGPNEWAQRGPNECARKGPMGPTGLSRISPTWPKWVQIGIGVSDDKERRIGFILEFPLDRCSQLCCNGNLSQ